MKDTITVKLNRRKSTEPVTEIGGMCFIGHGFYHGHLHRSAKHPTPKVHDMTYIIIREGGAHSYDDKDYATEAKALDAAKRYARREQDDFYVYAPVKVVGPKTPAVKVRDVKLD